MCYEIRYFVDINNAAWLARDASQGQGLSGETLGVIAITVSSVVVGLVISVLRCWKLALLVQTMLPLVMFTSYIDMRLMTGFSSESVKQFVNVGTVAAEAVENINTIAPLRIQDELLAPYNENLVTLVKNGDKNALLSGI